MKLDGPAGPVEVSLDGVTALPDGSIKTPDGVFHVAVARGGDAVWVSYNGEAARFTKPRPEARVENDIRAPMTGKVVDVRVKAGDAVKAGDVVAILAAMKMEFRLEAPRDGVVESVDAATGQLVDLGQRIAKLQ